MKYLGYLNEEILNFYTKNQKDKAILKHLTYSGWGVWKDIRGNSYKWNSAKSDFDKIEVQIQPNVQVDTEVRHADSNISPNPVMPEIGNIEKIVSSSLKDADSKNLPIGTVLQFNGYNDKYVIVKKFEDTRPTFNTTYYDTINLRTFEKSRHDSLMKHLSEKKDNRIAIYWTDKIMSPQEIEETEKNAIQAKIDKELAVKKQNEQDALLKQKFIRENPDLIKASEFEGGSSKLAAKNVRIELKKKFNNIKFKVLSDHNSVHITWNNGPNADEVKQIVDKYKAGYFDGMNDSYNYSYSVWTDIFGSANYVIANRHISNDKYVETAKENGYDETIFNNLDELRAADHKNEDLTDMLRRETRKKSYSE